MRRLAVWFVDLLALTAGKAIDAGCELFNLDEEEQR